MLINWIRVVRKNRGFFSWLVGLVAALCLLDFFSRVYVGRDGALRRFAAPAVQPLRPTMETATIAERLSLALPPPPSAEEAARVRPREIALQAVFGWRQSRRAVLVLLPQDDTPIEQRAVGVGVDIDGWLVERIEASKVTLRKGTETKELVMFRTK